VWCGLNGRWSGVRGSGFAPRSPRTAHAPTPTRTRAPARAPAPARTRAPGRTPRRPALAATRPRPRPRPRPRSRPRPRAPARAPRPRGGHFTVGQAVVAENPRPAPARGPHGRAADGRGGARPRPAPAQGPHLRARRVRCDLEADGCGARPDQPGVSTRPGMTVISRHTRPDPRWVCRLVPASPSRVDTPARSWRVRVQPAGPARAAGTAPASSDPAGPTLERAFDPARSPPGRPERRSTCEPDERPLRCAFRPRRRPTWSAAPERGQPTAASPSRATCSSRRPTTRSARATCAPGSARRPGWRRVGRARAPLGGDQPVAAAVQTTDEPSPPKPRGAGRAA